MPMKSSPWMSAIAASLAIGPGGRVSANAVASRLALVRDVLVELLRVALRDLRVRLVEDLDQLDARVPRRGLGLAVVEADLALDDVRVQRLAVLDLVADVVG